MSGRNASLSGSATKKEHYHAFLSHNGADKSLVEKIARNWKSAAYAVGWITGIWFQEIPGNPPSKKPSANATAACLLWP